MKEFGLAVVVSRGTVHSFIAPLSMNICVMAFVALEIVRIAVSMDAPVATGQGPVLRPSL